MILYATFMGPPTEYRGVQRSTSLHSLCSYVLLYLSRYWVHFLWYGHNWYSCVHPCGLFWFSAIMLVVLSVCPHTMGHIFQTIVIIFFFFFPDLKIGKIRQGSGSKIQVTIKFRKWWKFHTFTDNHWTDGHRWVICTNTPKISQICYGCNL